MAEPGSLWASGICRFDFRIGQPEMESILRDLGPPPKLAAERYLPPEGDHELVEILEEKYGHAYRVLVTGGAHQALVACTKAIAALKASPYMDCQPAYYPGLKHVALAAGCEIRSSLEDYYPKAVPGALIAAWPNNPDGMSAGMPAGVWDVWDAVYADQAYGWNGSAPMHRVIVGSVSKAFGLPGLRVGWIACRKEEEVLYPYLTRYVEALTEGISGVTQHYAKQALMADAWGGREAWRKALRTKLLTNSKAFSETIGWVVEQTLGVPHDGTGMFAYFRVKDMRRPEFATALKEVGVALMPGEACGAREIGWYRMSMARDPKITLEALELINRAMRQ